MISKFNGAIRIGLSLKYLYTKSKSRSELQFNANLLVVKKEVYASIAKICIESFLHFHPKSTVTVHVDEATRVALNHQLKKALKRGNIRIETIENQHLTWQELKLNLILSLTGLSEFFMDADLKWNGTLNELSDITFFVKEFQFNHNLEYRPLTAKKWFKTHTLASMKNTSFFYWGNYNPSLQDKQFIDEVMCRIRELSTDGDKDLEFIQSTIRISEQIALSLLVEKTGRPIRYLKDSDGYKDGAFVESTYFGATGTSF